MKRRRVICRACGKPFVPETPLQTCCAKCWDDDDGGVVVAGQQETQEGKEG